MTMSLGVSMDARTFVPGSPQDVVALATEWNVMSQRVLSDCDGVHAASVRVDWTGSAADAYAMRVERERRHGIAIAESLTAGASILMRYADELRAAQAHAQAAIEMWAEADRSDSAGIPDMLSASARQKSLANSVVATAQADAFDAASRAASALRAASVRIDEVGRSNLAANLESTMSTATDADRLLVQVSILQQLSMLNTPAVTNSWWLGLDLIVREQLIKARPDLVGNLEGITYSDRHTANVLELDNQIRHAQAMIDTGSLGLPPWSQVLRELNGVKAALGDPAELAHDGLPPRQLIGLGFDDHVLAAISVGNLDAATNITYAVPGINNTTENMTGWVNVAQRLQSEQRFAAPEEQNAVVAWMGYDTAKWGEAVMNDSADRGAQRLNQALAGTAATQGDARLNVVGHSNGASTASTALSTGSTRVDTFVSVADSGYKRGIFSTDDLNADSVFVGQAERDKTADVGRLSPFHAVDPARLPGFGAQTFGTDNNPAGSSEGGAPVTVHDASNGESGYFDGGTESLRNIANATTGNHDDVTPDETG